MSCRSCSTGSCGSRSNTESQTSGCRNNGACGTGGCNKMNVFDWLSNMDIPPTQRFDVVEVKFKGGRKEYFKNPNKLDLYTGDPVVVETVNGHTIGTVSLQGELVRLQILKKNIKNDEIKIIYRVANQRDLEKHDQAIARDMPALYRTREMANELKLGMKISDVEFQSDNTKATFYYSADDRVDFRELIKSLAGEFKVRVEMKQISLRQEAGRLGGVGVCGRELCCSTWLTDFKNVNTSAARYQSLSLNPVKLSGQCGRLKCCLNYELETYMDALKGIPEIEKPLQTGKGTAYLQKTDIFKRIMWFGYKGDETNWFPVAVERVVEVLKLNEQGIVPVSFDNLDLKPEKEEPEVKNADLKQMDKHFNSKDKGSNKGNWKDKNQRNNGEKKFQKPEARQRPDSQGQDQQSQPKAEGNSKTPPNNQQNNEGGEKKNFKKPFRRR
jgi:cell fate regulator YaaT (PSP1 superfamily)